MRLGDIFCQFYKIISLREKESISIEKMERLMDDIRVLRAKEGLRLIFNNIINIMLEKIRGIHIEKIREINKNKNEVNILMILNFCLFYLYIYF
jgi:hypothetical protein